MLTLLLSMYYSYTQNYFPFLSQMTKGKSLRSSHLLVTGRASTIILISIIIITGAIIIALILWSWWRWRWRHGETIHDNLLLCDTTNTGVHLTQLITESVKASIHVLKLSHDGLKSHTTRGRKRSGGGWSGRGWRSRRLGSWPLQLKLCLTLSNGRAINCTHIKKWANFR